MPASHTELFVHFVWTTMRRDPTLEGSVREDVYKIILAQCRDLDCEVLALNGTDDHVHLLVRMSASVTVRKLAKQVKSGSSHFIRQERGRPEFTWQEGYGAFTVSRWDIGKVKQYVYDQEQHHRNGTTKPYFEPD
jgi:REP element-mobilizing transposase RayT